MTRKPPKPLTEAQRKRRREAQRRRRAVWYATRLPTKWRLAGKARDKARRAGKMHFVGQLCKRGHVGGRLGGGPGSKRWVSTDICLKCDQLRRAEMSSAQRAKVRRQHNAYGRRATFALKVLQNLGVKIFPEENAL
jgi:hypothetical protein